MPAQTFKQTEDLNEPEFRSASSKSLFESKYKLVQFIKIDKNVLSENFYTTRISKFLLDVIQPLSKAIEKFEFSFKGLRNFFLLTFALSTSEVEWIRYQVFLHCLKFGLILLLYRKARAPPYQCGIVYP